MRDSLSGTDLYAAIAAVLVRHFGPRSVRAWIIGSEATSTTVPGSDVDIALEADDRIDLERLARVRAELEELPTLRSFDLVDLRRTTADFRKEALGSAKRLLPADEGHARVEG